MKLERITGTKEWYRLYELYDMELGQIGTCTTLEKVEEAKKRFWQYAEEDDTTWIAKVWRDYEPKHTDMDLWEKQKKRPHTRPK